MWRLSSRFAGLGGDLALLALSSVIALWLRENLDLPLAKLGPLGGYITVLLAAAIPVGHILGLPNATWQHSSMADFRRIVIFVCASTASATMVIFLVTRMENVSRSVPVLQAIISVIALIGVRVVAREWYQMHQRRQTMLSDIVNGERPDDDCLVIVGLNNLTYLMISAVEELSGQRLRVAGIVSEGRVTDGQKLQGYPLIGINQDLPGFITSLREHGMRVTRLVITVNETALAPRLRLTLHQLEQTHHVKCIHLIDLLSLREPTDPTSTNGQTPVAKAGIDRADEPSRAISIDLNGTHQALPESGRLARQSVSMGAKEMMAIARRPYLRLKRAVDALAALTAIVLLAPLFVLVALLVAVGIGEPVLFWQDRPGLGGQRFRLYKFRTMGDAYDAKGRPLPDGRINAVGHFLRATRLDELPQLWNILIGDMSFVGPRPLLIADQADGATLRHLLRPGLTGWAQVTGGRVISASDKMALDVWYVQNASFLLDAEIVARTIPMIAFGERVDRGAISRAWSDLRRSGMSPHMPQSEAARMTE